MQTLGAVAGYLEKGRVHCAASGIDSKEIVDTRLIPDMLPLRFQVVSVAHHSLGAIKGVEAGVFSPPPAGPELDYEGLQKLVENARTGLQAYTRESCDAFAGKEMAFKMGERSMPFLAEDFLMTFSLPNFYFHAATAYNILRMKGVPIGKRDFMGQMRLKK